MATTFYTPSSYDELLTKTFDEDLSTTRVTTITNKNRYLIKIGLKSTNYLGIQSTTSNNVFTTKQNKISSSSAKLNSTILGSTFQLTQNTFDASNNNSYYRIDTDLHSNFSLDCSWNSISSYSTKLQFVNNWGRDRSGDTLTYTQSAGTTVISGTGGATGYIVFEYDTKNYRLIARKRYYYDENYYINTGKVTTPTSAIYRVYNAGGGGEGHILDNNFTLSGYYLFYNGKSLSFELSKKYSVAILYNSPIDLSVPTQFYPLQPNKVTNLATSLYIQGISSAGLTILYSTNSTFIGGVANANNLSPGGYNYKQQMYTYDPTNMSITNKSSADTYVYSMLDTIFLQNSSLRYPKEFYIAFREGLLKNITSSHSLSNAYLTGRTVLQVFFTNETDSTGTYGGGLHPFMVILNTSSPSGPCRFLDVNRPPGDAINHNAANSSDGGYTNQYVTRNASYQSFLTKIPMRGDYGYAGSISEGSITDPSIGGNLNHSVMTAIISLAKENNKINYDHFNYASKSACGIAIDSTQLYPVLNNALIPSCGPGELTALGHHSGQGLGVHYHADSFQCGLNTMNLYNEIDYINQSHPPIIGMAFDGIALYGSYIVGYNVTTANVESYTTAYSTMDGYGIPLDSYGAHTHGDYGYHYHANPISSKSIPCYGSLSNSSTFPVYALLYGSWAGKLTNVPYFYHMDKPSQKTNYVGFSSNTA